MIAFKLCFSEPNGSILGNRVGTDRDIVLVFFQIFTQKFCLNRDFIAKNNSEFENHNLKG